MGKATIARGWLALASTAMETTARTSLPMALGSAGRAIKTRTIAASNNGERSRGEGFPHLRKPVVGEGAEMHYSWPFQAPSTASSSQERAEERTACMIRR